jgi:transposase
MIPCKRCMSRRVVRNGVVRGKQRYRCMDCKYNFIEGDDRVDQWLTVKKALALILFSLGSPSLRRLAHIFGVSESLIRSWVQDQKAKLPLREVHGEIKDMGFEQMRNFILAEIKDSVPSNPWIVAQGELWPGWAAIVMVQHCSGFRATRSKRPLPEEPFSRGGWR